MFKRKWQPSKAQRQAYGQRMRTIETAKNEATPDEYTINCTGDCVTGDEIAYFNPGKSNDRQYGKIVADSYGQAKQQHTFTIEAENGDKILIKGRNLYKMGVYRKSWQDESKRTEAIKEKHENGNKARKERQERKETKERERLLGTPDWATDEFYE